MFQGDGSGKGAKSTLAPFNFTGKRNVRTCQVFQGTSSGRSGPRWGFVANGSIYLVIVFRKPEGVFLRYFLKTELKADFELNPTSKAISSMVRGFS